MQIKRVILVGANGHLGPSILKALLGAGSFEVTVLTRNSSKSAYSDAVQIARVSDDLPKGELVKAFTGQDALVIAFGGSLKDNSIKLVDAAFEAGVKHVIPADFGSCDSSDPHSLDLVPLYMNKKDVRDHLIELSKRSRSNGGALTWTSLITAHFFDYGLHTTLLGLNYKEKSIKIFDGGNIHWSATTLGDTGLATASILKQTDHERLRNKLVYVQSIWTTQNELLSSLERVTGEKFKTINWSSEDYIKEHKSKLTGDVSNDAASTEELVAVEGLVNADWHQKGDLLVNDLLDMPKRDLDELVRAGLSS